MIKKMLCLLVIFFSILSASDQKIGIKTGIGFEFQTIGPLVAAVTNSSSSGGSLYLPMQTDKFMIEPNIYYNYESKEVDDESMDEIQEEYDSSLMFNIGLFFINFKSEKIKTYSGIRIGMATGKGKSINSWMQQEEEEYKAFLFGPTAGVEYFVSDYFSFGGEYTLRVIKGEKDITISGNGQVEDISSTILTPTLMLRFYF